MLIDDNEVDLFLQERVIANCSLAEKVESFSSPFKALDYIKSLLENKAPLPELIFLDINMPGMSGFQFLEQIEELFSGQSPIRFLILTSSESQEDKVRAAGNPMVKDYLVKPLLMENLSNFMS